MDDRALAKRIQELSKAISGQPADAVVKLLEELKDIPAPTEEQLRVSLPQNMYLGHGCLCCVHTDVLRAVDQGRCRCRQAAHEQ